MSFLANKKVSANTNKKPTGKEFQNIEDLESNDGNTIRFNNNQKKELCSVSKSTTKNLIDEATDEEFNEYENFNEYFVSLFDEEANEAADSKAETLTNATTKVVLTLLISNAPKSSQKQFNETTVIHDKCYAIYKQRNDGNNITKSGTDLHNGYVGPDRVTAGVDGEEVDEIKDFNDCRYPSACEAAWRIYGFDIHYRTPLVERLPFHLQDEQSVIFDATESIDYILEKSSVNETKFVQWMELNKTGDFASTDACYARGLLQDDKEYIDGLLEASQWGLGEYFRSFFVMLLMTDSMLRPEFVWEKTWHVMAADVENVECIKQNKPGGMFFVYGYGGIGKTYLYKTMSDALRSKGDILLNVASSGIVTLLLEGGKTAHSRFEIPINILEDSMCHIPADSDLANLIHQAKLIIWDEAPMIQSYC
ncbi:ATP-dependent DNA helicase PIF1-like protein [Tanacetum coccineum]